MATRASIEMDFKRAKAQAAKLEQIASDMDGLANEQLNGSMQNLSSGWKGENANAYIAKGEKLQSKMNASASDLRNVASDIRRAAERIYRAELAALELAEKRLF